MKKPLQSSVSAGLDVATITAALKQAAKNARRLARMTRTPLIVWRDGKIVDANALQKRPASARQKRAPRRTTMPE